MEEERKEIQHDSLRFRILFGRFKWGWCYSVLSHLDNNNNNYCELCHLTLTINPLS